MDNILVIDYATGTCMIVAIILLGFVAGIYSELSNYRKDVKAHLDFLSEARKEIREDRDMNANKVQEIANRVEYLEMYITSRK